MLLRKTMPLAAVAGILLAATGAPALAADSGFYIGAFAGQSLFHQDKGDADAAILGAFTDNGFTVRSASSSLDKTDVAFGGLVGYRFIPALSVEAAYVDLGKLNYKSTATVSFMGSTLPATATMQGKAKGPTLAVLGSLPLSPDWELYGRAGLFFSKVTLTVGVTVSTVAEQQSLSANSVDPLLGVGLAWHAGKQVAFRAEYTRFANVGDKDKTGQMNIDLFNLGVIYSF